MLHRKVKTENLEQDLWIWRRRCQLDGKKIPKRLVQARAKWAFQKEGITDFKVKVFSFFCPTAKLLLLTATTYYYYQSKRKAYIDMSEHKVLLTMFQSGKARMIVAYNSKFVQPN